jgi:hypothetical protein
MIVMPANSTGIEFGRLCGMYPSAMGHLLSPGAARGPWPWLPYALDNGAFSAFTRKVAFDDNAFLAHCDWARGAGPQPLWVVVPDVVTDAPATLARWREWAPVLRRFGWPLAFAAQDGHEPGDVPLDADVVFIGGSTEWKLHAIQPFCAAHRRVHVGRVNTYGRLRICADAGAESCDGTGWFRGDRQQLAGLIQFLQEEAGEVSKVIPQYIEGVA